MPRRSRRYFARIPQGDDDDDLDDLFRPEACDWCGRVKCTCDDALFDADELGLDPEDDGARRYREAQEDDD